MQPLNLIYFSPTSTTKNVLHAVAMGVGTLALKEWDLTLPYSEDMDYPVFGQDMVVIGVPVYAGRVPATAVKRLRMLKGDKTPVALVVTYGNRAFEDALVELRDIAVEQGFVPVIAAAFIGEHSYSTQDMPIAMSRPDIQDHDRGLAFGEQFVEKLNGLDSLDDFKLELPGNYPYRDGISKAEKGPDFDEDKCLDCGACVDICPVGAVSVEYLTDKTECIRCQACVKNCPGLARFMEDAETQALRKKLHDELAAGRKEPEFFL